MEYGVRHYETAERLRWFLIFIFCLLLAYPVAVSYSIPPTWKPAISAFKTHAFTTSAFWLQLPWLRVPPLGGLMIYLFWVGALFLLLKAVFLMVQVVGKYKIQAILEKHIDKRAPVHRFPTDSGPTNWNKLFPADIIHLQTDRTLFQLMYHPFRRVRLMLNHPKSFPASEGLLERERRASEVDWELLAGSWSPFQWILWALPLLAFSQVLWLLYQQSVPVLSGQGELAEILSEASVSILPFAQSLAAVIVLALAAALLKRIESLYLSSLNALLYDAFLSRIPFQSGDTVILLEAFQKSFQEIQSILRRLERSVASSTDKAP